MSEEDDQITIPEPSKRLCSEIQLFDLCDLESCTFKDGRFCTNNELLSRFEKIADNEARTQERYMTDDFAEDEEDGEEFGSGFSTGDFDEDDESWEDE